MRNVIAAAICCLLLLTGVVAQEIAPAELTRIRETHEAMASLQQDLNAYRLQFREFPDNLEVLIEIYDRESIPKDAWGRDLEYTLTDGGFRLVSWGRDGEPGGEGADEDIVYTERGVEASAAEREERARLVEDLTRHARVVVSRERMKVVGLEIARYRSAVGSWPDSLGDVLEVVGEKHIRVCFVDAWGNPFEYRTLPHDSFAVISRGADGQPGGKDEDADLVVTEREIRRYLASLVAPRWRWWGGGRGGTDHNAEALARDIERYLERHDELPKTLEDLTVAVDQRGAIRRSIPNDRWGNPYLYVRIGDDQFHVVGLGKDARPGGVGDNVDAVHPKPGRAPSDDDEDSWWREEPVRPAIDLDRIHRQRAEIAEAQLENLWFVLTEYKEETGAYPESLDDLTDHLPAGEVPLDPWGNAFVYERTEEGFVLTCLGSDGEAGGTEHAADITYNENGKHDPDND